MHTYINAYTNRTNPQTRNKTNKHQHIYMHFARRYTYMHVFMYDSLSTSSQHTIVREQKKRGREHLRLSFGRACSHAQDMYTTFVQSKLQHPHVHRYMNMKIMCSYMGQDSVVRVHVCACT